MLRQTLDYFKKPQDPFQLGLFRIGFGLFLLWESLYFYRMHLIEDYLLAPKFHFTYSFLPVPILPEFILQLILAFLLISSILITLGMFFRFAMGFYLLGFSYFMLCDKVFYNNHLYLIALLCLIMLLIPADEGLSLKRGTQPKGQAWNLWILRIQIVLVYLFGGISKLNSDWLISLEPVNSLLFSKGISSQAASVIIAYGGTAFDLFIGFFLLVPRLRWFGLAGVLVFNTLNHLLFDDINIFPFLMMFSGVLFLQKKDLSKIGLNGNNEYTLSSPTRKSMVVLVSAFLCFQILFPLRHLIIPGNTDWTGEGARFSWRMKLQIREVEKMEFWIYDLDTKTIYPVEKDLHISRIQQEQMAQYPQMMLQFAQYLGKMADEVHSIPNTMVKAEIRISMNKRAVQQVINPESDMLKLSWSAWHNEWIEPLRDLTNLT